MKKVLILIALVGLSTTTFATSSHKLNKEKTSIGSAQVSLSEVADNMGMEEAEIELFFGMETQTVKIYNTQDELIAEGELDFAGQPTDPEVAKAIRNAGRVMTMGNTHIYRSN